MASQLLEHGARRRAQDTLGAYLRRVDFLLLAAVSALTLIGLVMIYSATRTQVSPTTGGEYGAYFLKRQLVYVVLAGFIMVVAIVIDYRKIREWGWVLYGLIVFLLLAVRVAGTAINTGTEREITVGPIAIQPSEFAVVAVIIAIAKYVQSNEESLNAKAIVRILATAGLPMVLVYFQPDLGTTLIIAIIVLALLLLSGVRIRYLAALLLTAVGAFLIGHQLHILQGYQVERLTSFLHQNGTCASGDATCYQLTNSETAIGAGGLHGTGLFNGAVTNTGFVPEEYADFIFSAIGEQLGFFGSILVVALYAIVAFRLVRAMQLARDSFGRLFCGGTLVFICFSAFQNIGMTVGIMPITGIPLPFISYGGSALFATFAAIGIVINVELRRGSMR